MARAKRTARADARRRHRAQMEPDAGEAGASLEEGAAPVAPQGAPARREPRRATSAAGQGLGGPERLAPAGGIRNAFRLAFRPLNLREDLALLPRLVTHRAFWLPVLLAAVNAGAVIAFQGRELISQFAMTYFLLPPPIGAIFLAGFLAPRASYLIGALVAVVASFLFAITVALVPSLFPTGSFMEGLVTALATSPVAGILFASAAAWYRRFLYLASPARQLESRRPPAQRGKPAKGR